MACRETTEACLEEEPTSLDRKPEVSQEEEATVEDAERMLVGRPKKWRRDRNSAAEKAKDRTQNQDGCRKKLAVARMEAT
jgi:hypothetical protein